MRETPIYENKYGTIRT